MAVLAETNKSDTFTYDEKYEDETVTENIG